MYPWEKTSNSEPEPESDGEAEAFPWDAVAEPVDVSHSMPLVELSVVEERLVSEIAANGSWAMNAPATFAYNEPEEADWRPVALVLAGAICVGALAVFALRQPESSSVTVVRRVTTEQTTTEVLPPTIAPPAGTLIRPTDTRAVVSKTIEDGGRANPFRNALPPVPAPEVKLTPVPVVAAPRPLPPPPPPTPVFGVVSVAVSGDSRAAMIQVSGLESAPSLHEVTVGDQVEGWSVREINSQRVLLARGKKTQSLSAQ